MDTVTAQVYRMNEIKIIQSDIEEEKVMRYKIVKRYNSVFTVIDIVKRMCLIATMSTNITSLGVLTTILDVNIAIIMNVITLVSMIMFLFCGRINKYISLKISKHEQIKNLAKKKMNTLSDLVSRGLEDNAISDSEFSNIISENSKYQQIKHDIKHNIRRIMDTNLDNDKDKAEKTVVVESVL